MTSYKNDASRSSAGEEPSPEVISLLVALFNQKRYAEVEAIVREMTESFPQNGFSWKAMGTAFLQQGRTALAPLQKAAELPQGDAQLYNNLGNTFSKLGRLSEAEVCYRRTIELKPDFVEAHNNLGSTLMKLNRLPEAEASYRRELELNPDYAEPHVNLGLALLKLGRLEEAEASCRQALQIKPDFVYAQSILSNILRTQGVLPDYLAPDVFDSANGRLLRRYFPLESSAFIYCIEVSGTCNLRCPSCPIGNFSDASRPKGFMKLDLFRDIVEKIKRERIVVGNPQIWLFNWGEPLLHPKLPEMISILKQNGFYVMISTNLNIKKNLEEVIRSGPDSIKISLSGFTQEFYSKTHVKGNIERVKENMNLVRELINKFNVPTQVWVGHHLYRHNRHESVAIEGLCRALGFDYRPIQAFYQPLEKMVDLIEGKCPASENDLLANLPVHPLDYLAQKKKVINKDLDCEARFNMSAINYDGSVALCCGTYDYQNMLGVNFLDTSHDEIQKLKYQHPFCKKCYDYGLQYSEAMREPSLERVNLLVALFNQKRYAEVEAIAQEMTESFPQNSFSWKAMGTALLQQGRTAEALAPLQKAAELSQGDAQLYNNLGSTFSKLGRLSEAETCYRQTIELKPGFAEAHNNLGLILLKLGRLEEAEASCRQALQIKPGFADAQSLLGNIFRIQGVLPD